MNWFTLLIPLLSELFENCPQDSASQAKNIKRNGPVVQLRIRRALRKDGLRGKRLRRAAKNAAQDIDEASIEDITEFIEELKAS